MQTAHNVRFVMTYSSIRRIKLTYDNIKDRDQMAKFMKNALDLPDYFGGNLDALSDMLDDINLNTVFEVDEDDLPAMYDNSYAAKTLKVISDASERSPFIHLYLMG